MSFISPLVTAHLSTYLAVQRLLYLFYDTSTQLQVITDKILVMQPVADTNLPAAVSETKLQKTLSDSLEGFQDEKQEQT